MQLKYLVSMLLALGATGVIAREAPPAAAQMKSYIVSYDASTPRAIVDQAIAEIKREGASVTHEYEFIKAFAVTTTAMIIDEFNMMDINSMYKPMVEEDQVVSIND